MATRYWKSLGRLEVHVGEGGVVVVDVEECECPPETPGDVRRQTPVRLGHLGLGQPVAGRDEQPVDHEQVDDVVLDRPGRSPRRYSPSSWRTRGPGPVLRPARRRHRRDPAVPRRRGCRRATTGRSTEVAAAPRHPKTPGGTPSHAAYTGSVPPSVPRPSDGAWAQPLGPRAVLVPVKAFGDAKGRLTDRARPRRPRRSRPDRWPTGC